MVGSLHIHIGTSCFESVCSKCHLPTLMNKDFLVYCNACKCVVSILNKARVTYKIKVDNGEEVDHVSISAWIKLLLGCMLTMLEEFKSKQGVHMKVFKGKWLVGNFFKVLLFK